MESTDPAAGMVVATRRDATLQHGGGAARHGTRIPLGKLAVAAGDGTVKQFFRACVLSSVYHKTVRISIDSILWVE
jgi:hypothetical protein